MPKLTEAHIEQIKNMRKDGKTGRDIIEFFSDNYRIHLDPSEISRAAHLKKPRKTREPKPGAPRPQDRKESEFALHIHAAYDIHKKDFLTRVQEAVEC